MKFVVFGDLHYCTLTGRPRMEAECKTFACLPDYLRYAEMECTVRKPLAEMAKKEKPEIVISCGDLIEGGSDSARDMAEANAYLLEIAPEIYRAPGSHAGGRLPQDQSCYPCSHKCRAPAGRSDQQQLFSFGILLWIIYSGR
jgi:hypothetical protein